MDLSAKLARLGDVAGLVRGGPRAHLGLAVEPVEARRDADAEPSARAPARVGEDRDAERSARGPAQAREERDAELSACAPARAGEGGDAELSTPAPDRDAELSTAAPADAGAGGDRLSRVRRMLEGMIARHRREALDVRAARVVGSGVDAVRAARGHGIGAEQGGARARSAPRPLPGSRRSTPFGVVHVAETMLAPDHHHGRVPIAHALAQRPAILAALALDPRLADVELRGMLLLDTETTGLSGGTGTIPFLIGLARFEDESLVIEQLLLFEPGQEQPMLELLLDRISRASLLVTYNGKSFDWPLLATRLVLHRLAAPALPPHLDLLHSVRRIYKRRLGSSRLVMIEQALLGMRREHDIEGFEIPSLYWSFARGEGDHLLAPVLEHNANDLVALAAVLAVVAQGFEAPCPKDEPLDHLGRAEVALRAGDRERAGSFAQAAAEGGGGDEVTQRALVLAARVAMLDREIARARSLLVRALEHCAGQPEARARIHLRLAKIAEHRARDFALAMTHARHAAVAEGALANARRIERLERRISRGRSAVVR